MLLRGEMSSWRRACAVVLGAVIACMSWGLLPAGASAARHYEKVSPADKGQGDIVGDGLTTVASRDGDAVAFASRTPFGDTIGSGIAGQTQFVARRTDAGWVTHAITPTSRPDAVQTFFTPTVLQIYSEDLRTAVIWAYDLPAVTTDTPLRTSIYVEDTETRELETVTVSQFMPPSVQDFQRIRIWGISADARHLSFVTPTQFLSQAQAGVPNVYRWDDGVLSLAGVLHDGTVPAAGSDLIPENYRGAMSADGTRLVFTASSRYGPSQLFMSIAGARSTWITQPELTDDPVDPLDDDENEANPSSTTLEGVTRDGRTVFFITDAGLVDGDTNGAPDLYRYVESADPERDGGNLTQISRDGSMGDGDVVGMSDDGERVYFYNLTSELFVWDGGAVRLINSAVGKALNALDRIGVMESQPGMGRVTPDGEYLAFAHENPLLGDTNGRRQMYLYSYTADRLICISCPQGSLPTSNVNNRPDVTAGFPQPVNVGFRPTFLTDDGHVFFSTADALVTEDRNGVADAYEYDPVAGRAMLLSTGEGSQPTNFVDASASGDDVFLITRQRLVRSDKDDLADVYDAREGSMLVEAPEEEIRPVCQGEACQPPPSASPLDEALGSEFFDAGDAAATSPAARIVAKQRVTLRGASGTLRVRLTSAGTLRWRGRGLRSGSVRRGRGGAYDVRLRLGRRARARLAAAGAYTTSVRLTFVAANGDDVTRTTRVMFRAVATKKGR